jgi:hypothetical protein
MSNITTKTFEIIKIDESNIEQYSNYDELIQFAYCEHNSKHDLYILFDNDEQIMKIFCHYNAQTKKYFVNDLFNIHLDLLIECLLLIDYEQTNLENIEYFIHLDLFKQYIFGIFANKKIDEHTLNITSIKKLKNMLIKRFDKIFNI